MIGTLMGICIFGMFLVGVLVPLGILIYLTVIFIKEEIEINNLIKKAKIDKLPCLNYRLSLLSLHRECTRLTGA